MNNLLAPFALPLELSEIQALPGADKSVRRLADMATLYHDREAVEALTATNPLIYEFGGLESRTPEQTLSFGVTRICPGTVGREYFMTKGHYHLNAGDEIYLALRGEGLVLLQSRDGRRQEVPLAVGQLAYIPTGWAHRTVNTGETDLLFISIWPARIEHDYETIARSGFPRLVVKDADGPRIIPNPTFREA